MVMEVEIISKELIIPSSPTPNHLGQYKLSFLDQLAPHLYSRLILCYEANGDGTDHIARSLSLKQSLSKALTCFYPLAGRATLGSVIECNDMGAEYSEARVPCKLSEFVARSNDDGSLLDLALSPYLVHGNFENEVLLSVQYNMFDCGGFAIGVSISHKLVDATSILMFLKSWAAISRGDSPADMALPNFDAVDHFPQQEVPQYLALIGLNTKDKTVVKRFVFNKSSVATLQAAASLDIDSREKRRTRVEAVSAFMTERFMALSKSKSTEETKLFAAYQTVNLREKANPPLTNTFGNLWRPAVQILEVRPNEKENLSSVATQISNSIKKVNGEFTNKLKQGQWYVEMMKELGKNYATGMVDVFVFTSWTRFPVYDIDFGWGKPVLAASPRRPYNNFTTLMSTKSGDGIEAWVTLLEEDMKAFEHDPELIKFASSAYWSCDGHNHSMYHC